MGRANRPLRAFIALISFVSSSLGSYVITVPKTWSPGGELQVCVQVNNPNAPQGGITVSIEDDKYSRNQQYTNISMLMQESIQVPQGNQHLCSNITLPNIAQVLLKEWERGDIIHIDGTLDGLPVSHNRTIHRQTIERKIIIQTDRAQYKPGQTVHFRVLSYTGPLMEISTENYQEINVTSRSGSKLIAQWSDVDNSKGLVHLSFQVPVDGKGSYSIKVKSRDGRMESIDFSVREYVQSRFRVDVTPPRYILTTQSSFTFTACAKYPFGEPVKGRIHWEVRDLKSLACSDVIRINNTISGCSDITIQSRDFRMIECDIHQIEATATIADEDSGKVERGRSRVSVDRNAVTFETLYQDDFMKPNLPFTLKVLAKLPDGSPASGEPLEICHGDLCNNITTPLDGIVKLYLTNPNSQRVAMKHMVSRALLDESPFVHTAKRFYSPSNSSLNIHAPEEDINCPNGEEIRLILEVLFAAVRQKSAVVNVQVMSRGKIQYFKSEEYQLTSSKLPFEEEFFVDHQQLAPPDTVTGFLNIPVTLPLTAAPEIKVLVWYIRDDGEVVSDVREMTVKKCFPNKADFAWSTNRTQPGLQTSLTITSTPGSLCSYGAVGKGVYLETTRGDTETIDSFFIDDYRYNNQEYEQFYVRDYKQVNDRDYCKRLSEENPKDNAMSYEHTDYVDTLHMFDQSGLYVFTNLTLETRPCLDLGFRHTVPSETESEHVTKTNFHETWLWNMAVVPTTGILKQDVEVPQTNTEWIGSAVCVHPLVGVGVSRSSSLITYTSFYVDMLHPPSIDRGEDLLLNILVFNNLQQPLPVRVTLEGSTEYELIGENHASLPAGQRLSCVASQDKDVHTIKIRPTTVGHVNITVRASVETETSLPCGVEFLNIDKKYELESQLRVTREGYLRRKTWRKYICAKAEDQGSLETAELIVPSGMVEGSEKARITVEGEQLTLPLEYLLKRTQRPQKSPDDHAVSFIRNLLILKYLEATRQETPGVRERVLDFMKTGYQRQLLYQRLDGSFSTFGKADESGSTSLTAFVLKIFAQAKEYIQIDEGSLNAASSWLINNYGNETCAESIGDTHTTERHSHEESSRVVLTANILIALLESGLSPSHPTLQRALRCLTQDQSLDYFTMALRAYALALAGNPEAPVVLDQLMEQATFTDTSIKWHVGITDFGYKIPYQYDDETSGIVILAMIATDPSAYGQELRKLVRSFPIPDTSFGPYSSRSFPCDSYFDDYFAIRDFYYKYNENKTFIHQALATYESTHYHGDLNVNVTVEARDFHHTFFVTESNKSEQEVYLPMLPTNVSFSMKGQGCALVQTILQYNDPKPEDSDSRGL